MSMMKRYAEDLIDDLAKEVNVPWDKLMDLLFLKFDGDINALRRYVGAKEIEGVV